MKLLFPTKQAILRYQKLTKQNGNFSQNVSFSAWESAAGVNCTQHQIISNTFPRRQCSDPITNHMTGRNCDVRVVLLSCNVFFSSRTSYFHHTYKERFKRVVRQLIRVLRRNDRTNQKTKTANNLSDNSRTSDNWKTQFENTSHMIYRQRRLCSKFSLISMILRSCHEIL